MPDELGKFVLGDTAISAIEQAHSRKKRLFGRRKIQRAPLAHCENCGTQLEGHWCAKCGQPAIDYRRSFRHVLADLLNEFLNWDSKVFATIGLLIARPWILTNQFLAGHRVRYVHPLRVYLLASILFFFAATYGIKSVHLQPIDLSPSTRAEIRSELQQENVSPEIREKVEQAFGGKQISAEKRAILQKQLEDDNLPKPARDAIQQRLEYGDPAPWDTRAKLEEILKDLPPDARTKVAESLKKAQDKVVIFEADKDEKKPNDMPKWLEKRAREKFGEHGTNIQLFLVTLMSNLPYMMLVCIPLFACVLKILYIRRRIFYIDHLVYALHIHSFAYVAIVLIVLATIGLERAHGPIVGWIIAVLWTVFVVQIFLSIRRVYRQGWFISTFKFFFGGFIYLLVLVAAVAVTFFITLAMP